MIVKPAADGYRVYPNLQEADVTVVSIRPDFSDLEHKVLSVLGALSRAQALAEAATAALHEGSMPERFAEDFSLLLAEVL